MRFAARRAHGTGGKVALLLVLEPGGFEHWLGVESLMREDARIEAERVLAECSAMVEMLGGEKPKTHIREGKLSEEINRLTDEDRTISTLVLAAGVSATGRGRWSRHWARANRSFMCRSPLCPAICQMTKLTR